MLHQRVSEAEGIDTLRRKRMAIRIRKFGKGVVALCAATYKHRKGDLYLNDAVDHALRQKFLEDYKREGLYRKCGGAPSNR